MRADIIDFPAVTQSCGDCDWADCCVNRGAHADSIAGASSNRTAACRRNVPLFRQGEMLDSLYFLRSGSAKTLISTREGYEQIVTFHFPGDVIGFDGVTSGRHQSTTVTLETSGICRIPLAKLKAESINNSGLWDEVIRTVAAEIAEKQNYAVLLGQKSVHARFANFLCYLSGKFASRGCSDAEFNLSMSRQDIANYLSMAVETLSRLVSDFQRKELITVERRFVRINDVKKLKQLAHESADARVSLA
ncbi:MAG: helix-turn-helix domain-containing protein [Gammaproteobacteria bacterium]|jgi:CRP/FNR family transcriptional regulator